MASFTPINKMSSRQTSSAGLQDSKTPRDHTKPQSVASTYLGRDTNEPTVPASNQALHAVGAEKVGGKGKKRTVMLSHDAPKSRRRKSGDIFEGMSVTKPHKSTVAKPALRTTKPTSGRVNAKTNKAAAVVQRNLATVASVSIYTQPTSVDSVQHPTPQTSLEAVRSASGLGCTLYDGRRTSSPIVPIQVAQPWLNSIRSNDSPAETNTKTHQCHQREAAPRGDHLRAPSAKFHGARSSFDKVAATQDGPEFVRDESDDAAMFEPLAATAGHALKNILRFGRSKTAAKTEVQELTPIASYCTHETALARRGSRSSRRAKQTRQAQDEDFIDIDDHDEAAMVDLNISLEGSTTARERTPLARYKKQNMRDVDTDEDYGGALLSEAEKQLLQRIRSNTSDNVNKPILRKPFPSPILDRSPIFGAFSTTLLRTCFRVGEALNNGCQAVRTNANVLIELYARVTSSWREARPSRAQHFVFKDLYHNNPPHLKGTFTLWDQSPLWGLDSKAFLVEKPEGRMCRVMARMRRDGREWRLEVLSIWEAGWEDVDHVAGIYAREGE